MFVSFETFFSNNAWWACCLYATKHEWVQLSWHCLFKHHQLWKIEYIWTPVTVAIKSHKIIVNAENFINAFYEPYDVHPFSVYKNMFCVCVNSGMKYQTIPKQWNWDFDLMHESQLNDFV